MTQPIFTYNQEQALKAGNSQFISETGAYLCKIISAEYTQAQSGALSLELSVETQEGLKGNYLSIYYQGKDGQPLQGGHNMIQAIMGCTGVQALSKQLIAGKYIAPELTNKYIGLMLQKVLRLKQDGSDTYNFQILCPFIIKTRKTLSEHIENKPAERIDWLVAHTKDRDERTKQQPQSIPAQNQSSGQPTTDFDDDMPF
ncbi:hypothetical protein NYR30_06905 [Gallibacterium salpingitidis]|uniref:hypothetical protein n=1 Tax=Gallibacterium salpingitidis TaxID=505341 RepID=UPI00266F4E44|nr:hypothetical protein [Gallibacterium salpingitidis]WKS98518.1 hypothetical protein NYR30_06905 [Gallibacterium salpingitidis]